MPAPDSQTVRRKLIAAAIEASVLGDPVTAHRKNIDLVAMSAQGKSAEVRTTARNTIANLQAQIDAHHRRAA